MVSERIASSVTRPPAFLEKPAPWSYSVLGRAFADDCG